MKLPFAIYPEIDFPTIKRPLWNHTTAERYFPLSFGTESPVLDIKTENWFSDGASTISKPIDIALRGRYQVNVTVLDSVFRRFHKIAKSDY